MRRLAALDGLRGVAIALVVLFHMRQNGFVAGSLGVDVFFPLSGYLITGLLLREMRETGGIDLKRFYLRRTMRLYPAMAASVLLALALGGAVSGALHAMTYTTNLSIAAQPLRASDVLSPTWSLALEEQFYLCWPLAFLVLLPRIGARRLAGVAVVTATAGWGVLLWAAPASAYFRPDARIGGLMVGCAVALVGRGAPRVGAATAMVGLAVGSSAGFTEAGGALVAIPLVSVGVALCLPALANTDSPLTRALGWRPLVWIGARSYSIYLVNMIVIRQINPSQHLSTLEAIAGLVLVGLGGHLLWRFVEQPALAMRNRMTNSESHDPQRSTSRS